LITGRDTRVSFELLQGQGTAPAPATEAAKEVESSPKSQPLRTELIPRYLFSSFVEGAGNQFARAAASAVAEAPARTYNPLLIHGSVGLGKTHLMHAIGHRILEKNPRARVVYVTSEQFTNEFVSAIQHNELVKFRRRFRQADVLFIDDIQFLGGKERSQEEFFHTFNAPFDGNKQIVLTSDVLPKDIDKLEPRLRTRFEGGLLADMAPPDRETLVAILLAKAAALGLEIPADLADAVSSMVKGNIRELEGVLHRLAALTQSFSAGAALALTPDLSLELTGEFQHISRSAITYHAYLAQVSAKVAF
jgi:chromosomal replication initiator protein